MKTRRICLGAAAAVWAVGVGPAAVRAVGTPAYSVGHPDRGQLGASGAVTEQWLPVPVVGITDGVAIAAGYRHSLAVRSDGTVWAWGANSEGELGNGNTTDQWVAGPVSGLASVVAVAAGQYHSLARKSDGTVWAWGYNTSGQLGDGSTTQRTTPVQVSGLNDAIGIAAGRYHGLAIRSNGTVVAWGQGSEGQLGDGSATQRLTPVQVSGLSGAIRVAAGNYHSLAVLGDGTVRAWGYNHVGQLGDNSTTQRNTSVQVSGLTGAVAVAASGIDGGYHSLALKNDGTVWAWGSNSEGQLGDGSTTNRQVPVQVSGLTNAMAIAAGYRHSLAIKADLTAWGWGSNGYGRLGDGTPVNRRTPVQVQGLLASAIAGGEIHSLFLHAYDCNDPSPDCNGNGFHDGCDVLAGTSADCNTNRVPDECDAAGVTSDDCDLNTVPDECDNQTGDVTWIGGNGDDYNAASNWTPAGPPRGQSQAFFSHAGAADNRAILGDGEFIGACSAVIQASGSGKQILQINQDMSYSTGNGITINTGGRLDLRGGTVSGGPVANNSNDSIIGYGEISANLINAGLVTSAATKNLDLTGGSVTNQSNGTIRAAAASRIWVDSLDFSQEGSIELLGYAALVSSRAMTNLAGGSIDLNGGLIGAEGLTNAAGADMSGFGMIQNDFTNDGFTSILADTQIVGHLDNNGTVFIMDGVLTVTDGVTNNGDIIGQFNGRSGSKGVTVLGDAAIGADAAMVIAGGTLKISGSLDAEVHEPGQFNLTAGTLQVTGLADEGPLDVEVLAIDHGRNAVLPDASLFSIDTLRVGPGTAVVRLVNNRLNGESWGAEAMYVNRLTLDAGTTFDLAGQTLYFNTISPATSLPLHPGTTGIRLANGAVILDSLGGGRICRFGPVRGDGDVDGDCELTSADIETFVETLVGLNAGTPQVVSADMNADGLLNGSDVAAFVTRAVR